jgi:ADP-heptose:LPS heptosyltransferase/GT2 family glycosyltransferase
MDLGAKDGGRDQAAGVIVKVKLVSIIIISRKNEDTSALRADVAAQVCPWPTEVISIVDVSPPGRARNEGARQAQGEVLVFMDSDIRMDQKNFLVNLVSVLEPNPGIGLCCPAFLLPREANDFQKRYASEIAHSETPVEEKITDLHAVPSTCCAMPRELFVKLGGFHEVMIRGEDSELTERVKNADYRAVLAPRTWCYHPMPANFRKLARMNLRNGAGVAYVDMFFPHLNFDIHPAGHKYISLPQTWSQRQSRFFRMTVRSIRERKWLLFSAKFYYAWGYAFGYIRYSFRKKPTQAGLEQPKRILIIQLGGIGDLFLSVPALKALRAQYPQAQLSALVALRNRQLQNYFPYFDRVYSLDIRYGGKIPWRNFYLDMAQLWQMHQQKFDLAINMRTLASAQSARKMRLLLGLIGARVNVGRDTDGRGNFFDIRIPETMNAEKHEIEYNIDTVQALGVPVTDRNIDIAVNPETEKRVAALLGSRGGAPADLLIGLHIGGSPANQWPLEDYIKVMQLIKKDFPAKFVIALSKGERPLADRFSKLAHGAVIDLSGLLELDGLLALIKRCSLFISNDTGPMHLAALLKTPLVALIGQGDLPRYDVRRFSDKAIVLHKQVSCSPCYQQECKDLQCLRLITPEDVLQAARKLLKDGRP